MHTHTWREKTKGWRGGGGETREAVESRSERRRASRWRREVKLRLPNLSSSVAPQVAEDDENRRTDFRDLQVSLLDGPRYDESRDGEARFGLEQPDDEAEHHCGAAARPAPPPSCPGDRPRRPFEKVCSAELFSFFVFFFFLNETRVLSCTSLTEKVGVGGKKGGPVAEEVARAIDRAGKAICCRRRRRGVESSPPARHHPSPSLRTSSRRRREEPVVAATATTDGQLDVQASPSREGRRAWGGGGPPRGVGEADRAGEVDHSLHRSRH